MSPGVVMSVVMPWTPWRRILVGGVEGAQQGGVLVGYVEQPVVGYDDLGVDHVPQLHDALLGLDRTPPALEAEGPCHDADGERADRLGDLGDDRSRTGTGATPLASRDEDHVGALQRLLELGPVGLSRLAPDLRVPTGPQAPG
jgi:hypothetical protein